MIRLNWTERSVYSTHDIRFHVAWIRIVGDRWSVRASFKNLDKTTLEVAPQQWYSGKPSPNYGFSIVKVGSEFRSVNANHSSPRLPARIRPGATWDGVFSGTGARRLPRGVMLYVSFGYFVDPNGAGFSWLTQHGFRL